MQVHHGGAGTMATELKAGSTSERAWTCTNTNIIAQCREAFDCYQIHALARVKSHAMELAKLIENKDGVAAAVNVFHRHLPRELLLPTALVDGVGVNEVVV
ncbi:hypothetical protein V6N11_043951 [Hibiscus sabdariffa]|uniref:Uncharacterized protein n=1 Tax=Hibiscus sabdariffa TaxID=183260 RepID=A0ABR2REA4_9ROSI